MKFEAFSAFRTHQVAVLEKSFTDFALWSLFAFACRAAEPVEFNRDIRAELFGIGIVETLEDFGTSGALPSNQPLLDHLALRLSREHHWKLKPFPREIVLSSAYGQADAVSPALLVKDPKNRLVSRGPRQRLAAEMVRDQALLVSGLLSKKQFGPPVYPPQPDGIWKSAYSGARRKDSKGEDRYRRGI